MPLTAAIEAPRARLTDGARALESRLSADVQAEMRSAARGHNVMSGPEWTMKVGGIAGRLDRYANRP